MAREKKPNWLLLVIIVAFLLILLSIFVPVYGEICSKYEYSGAKHCSTEHIALVAFWQIIKLSNDFGSAITALATVFLVYVTWRLVVLGRDQSITTRAQLRAYMFTETSKMSNIRVDQFPVAEITIKNVGQTPAYNVKVNSSGLVFDRFDNANRLQPLGALEETFGSEETLGAGAFRTLRVGNANCQLDQARINKLSQQTHAIFAYGEITYSDTFG